MRLFLVAIMLLASCRDCDESENHVTPEPNLGSDMDTAPDGFVEPFDAELLGWGLHVIARGPDDIHVAGGTPDRGVLLHNSGDGWAKVDVPESPLLNWVAKFDDGQTAVAGNGGTMLWHDGSAWAVHETGTEEDLWGVFGTSSTDVWAVGGRGRAEGQATVLRYDGTTWAAAELPATTRSGVNAYFKVWGTAADNVYIVGQKGGCLHWNGTALAELDVGTTEDLISLWGTGPDDILFVGGRGNGVLAHWDGSSWFTESISPAPGVNGVWMPARGEFWLAGARGMLRRGTVNATGAGETGERSFDVPRLPPLSNLDFHAVAGVPGVGLIAVGGNFAMQDGPYEGLALMKTQDWE